MLFKTQKKDLHPALSSKKEKNRKINRMIKMQIIKSKVQTFNLIIIMKEYKNLKLPWKMLLNWKKINLKLLTT